MAESKNIALDFSAEENLLKENLPMDRRKNLYLICKEAVNNAVKYSGCKNLSVTFHKNKTNLHVAVADDGMGFDFNNNHDGNGLKNMTQRARDIQSQLSIHSEKNRGTKIEVALTL
jgi:signal transduction histidine kinase